MELVISSSGFDWPRLEAAVHMPAGGGFVTLETLLPTPKQVCKYLSQLARQIPSLDRFTFVFQDDIQPQHIYLQNIGAPTQKVILREFAIDIERKTGFDKDSRQVQRFKYKYTKNQKAAALLARYEEFWKQLAEIGPVGPFLNMPGLPNFMPMDAYQAVVVDGSPNLP